MRGLVLVFTLVCAALAVSVSAATAATNECKGLQVCVPVAGPWVVATSEQSEFQLDCPKNFIIGGLDAELSSRAIDVGFVGALGSPVNPGITTTSSAVFLGRWLGRTGGGTFRPHIGCIPASGGGQRTPTAYDVFKPGKPALRVVKTITVHPGTQRAVFACAAGQQLVGASHAVGFFTTDPPAQQLAAAVTVRQVVRAGQAHITVHAAPVIMALGSSSPVVQVDLVCAVKA